MPESNRCDEMREQIEARMAELGGDESRLGFDHGQVVALRWVLTLTDADQEDTDA